MKSFAFLLAVGCTVGLAYELGIRSAQADPVAYPWSCTCLEPYSWVQLGDGAQGPWSYFTFVNDNPVQATNAITSISTTSMCKSGTIVDGTLSIYKYNSSVGQLCTITGNGIVECQEATDFPKTIRQSHYAASLWKVVPLIL